jgi:hypothetical protein
MYSHVAFSINSRAGDKVSGLIVLETATFLGDLVQVGYALGLENRRDGNFCGCEAVAAVGSTLLLHLEAVCNVKKGKQT